MSQFIFTMTYRMVAIAATCLALLCILLFVLGVQIGKLIGTPVPPPAAATASNAPPAPAGGTGPTPADGTVPPRSRSPNP